MTQRVPRGDKAKKMKSFNPELNKDILALKPLSIQKDKTEFHKAAGEVMAKHGISLSTIYRELKKNIPGSYKMPNHKAPEKPVTEKEINMVKELLLKKVPIMNIGRIMEAETGEKYSWQKIDELRQIVDVRINESGAPLDSPITSSFGYHIAQIVEQALNFDKIAPNANVEFRAGDKKYLLNYQETRDIALICANAIFRTRLGYSDEITYLRAKMNMLLRDKIRTAPLNTSIKEYRNLACQLDIYSQACKRELLMRNDKSNAK